LVFQFQNLPFTHNMAASDTNASANGYAGSAMKSYLLGAFLTGLTGAGVPDSVLWAPTRYVANRGSSSADGTHTITDKLWLPTEWEMLGDLDANRVSNSTWETAANQTRLEYYTYDTPKYNSANTASGYWLASPHAGSLNFFCRVNQHGTIDSNTGSNVYGCATAFCVR
jgi:hypothetical protein